jgi:hypothetical protein
VTEVRRASIPRAGRGMVRGQVARRDGPETPRTRFAGGGDPVGPGPAWPWPASVRIQASDDSRSWRSSWEGWSFQVLPVPTPDPTTGRAGSPARDPGTPVGWPSRGGNPRVLLCATCHSAGGSRAREPRRGEADPGPALQNGSRDRSSGESGPPWAGDGSLPPAHPGAILDRRRYPGRDPVDRIVDPSCSTGGPEGAAQTRSAYARVLAAWTSFPGFPERRDRTLSNNPSSERRDFLAAGGPTASPLGASPSGVVLRQLFRWGMESGCWSKPMEESRSPLTPGSPWC